MMKESRKVDEVMRQDEIGQYTDNKAILDMKDFRDLSEDEREENEDYMEARAVLMETIYKAMRAAEWARMYRGVTIERDELDVLQALLSNKKGK